MDISHGCVVILQAKTAETENRVLKASFEERALKSHMQGRQAEQNGFVSGCTYKKANTLSA